jgi:hypothetical protein
MRNIFFALFGLFFLIGPALAFGQVLTTHNTTAYDGMSTTTIVTLVNVATIHLTEDRLSKGSCTIIYAEGDIPPHKMEALEGLEGLCMKYNHAQVIAAKLAEEFGITRYQALKASLESAFGWSNSYQINPTNGIEFEVKKIARTYKRAKKKAQRERIKKALIHHALTTTTKEIK